MNKIQSRTFLIKLHHSGLSYQEIADRFGISEKNIHSIIKEIIRTPRKAKKHLGYHRTTCYACGDIIMGERYLVKRVEGRYLNGRNRIQTSFGLDEGCFYDLQEKGIVILLRKEPVKVIPSSTS